MKKCIRSRAPKASTDAVHRVMMANVGKPTKPEIMLRRTFWHRGYRFRKDFKLEKDLPWKADIVFIKRRVCVFIDGCFWHGCSLHYQNPKTNAEWWEEKIGANIIRDRKQRVKLEKRGWLVIRVWEHEVLDNVGKVANYVIAALDKRQ